MSRKLTPQSTLDNLKKEAKRWLRAIRDNVAEARARFARAYPDAPSDPGLRDVQHAIAREHGLDGWTALRSLLAAKPTRETPALDPVDWFIRNACPDHHVRGGPAHVRAVHTAMRVLEHFPEVAGHSLCTSIVCGDLEAVERALAARPEAAKQKGGPKGWEPILYLCFTRLPLDDVSDHAVAIARALLDHGADPNVYFMAGDSRYTPLVGAIGEGEEDRPPHPRRDELVRLLLDRGAAPYDIQVIYNIAFHGKVLWFLKLMYEYSVQAGRKADWDDPDWRMLDMGNYGHGSGWHLGIAVPRNDLELAEWVLTHGGNPNPPQPQQHRMRRERSLHAEALRRGYREMAELLVKYGSTPTGFVPGTGDLFAAACFRLDREVARAIAAEHPELLRSTEVIFEAARQDRADVVELLLELGMSPDVEDNTKQRPLHMAAYQNSLAVARLLIERGAEIDPVESNWSNTPLGAAVYAQHQPMIELLGTVSRDIWELTYVGNVERVRDVLTEKPARATVNWDGHTPLMWLPPDDEGRAIEIARLLIERGADPSLRNKEGESAADRAYRLGMFELAGFLRTDSPAATAAPPRLEQFDRLAEDLVLVDGPGDSGALERLSRTFGGSLDRDTIRARVRERLPGMAGATNGSEPLTLDQARILVARFYGFKNWADLGAHVAQPQGDPRSAPLGMSSAPPFYKIDWAKKRIEPRPPLTERDWDTIFGVMQEHELTGLDSAHLNDAALERLSGLRHVTSLNLGGSRQLSDDGLRHLAGMPQLEQLDLSGWDSPITDRGLEVLRHLPELRRFQLCWSQRVSDAGVAHLTFCDHLEDVNLLGTPTGDGAINALTGKRHLRIFKTGKQVSDAGLALLHRFPAFKTWQGGNPRYSLMSADAEPTHLLIDGPFTDAGLAGLADLDGVFGLSMFWHTSAVQGSGLEALARLANLGFLGCEGKLCNDTAMRHIAAIPRLRMLMAQGTVAGDDGFGALSRSQTIEYIWGRECPNLGGRGFRALAAMPALRGIAVSCKHVDDTALAALPDFPALRELMPMDVTDEGFRHVGRCADLEALWCMYCRNTGDAATTHIAALTRLTSYYAGGTRITDRSLELLGRMASLERLEFSECAGITDAGVMQLAALPNLREITVGASPGVTREGVGVFPASVRVAYW